MSYRESDSPAVETEEKDGIPVEEIRSARRSVEEPPKGSEAEPVRDDEATDKEDCPGESGGSSAEDEVVPETAPGDEAETEARDETGAEARAATSTGTSTGHGPAYDKEKLYKGVLSYRGAKGPWVELRNVGVCFQKNSILEDITLRFEPGLTTAIVGPNGSGKSTLIKAMLGQYLHSGEISMGWSSKEDAVVSYVPQFIDFDRELPMNGVDFLGMLLQRKPVIVGLRKNIRPIVGSLLERVGMLEKRLTKIGSLSGGELKRMLLIQALYPEPGLVFLDEPMAALDEPGIEIFISILRDLQFMGKTIIWVEHDLMTVREHADRLVAVNKRIVHQGLPSDLGDGDLLIKIFSHAGG